VGADDEDRGDDGAFSGWGFGAAGGEEGGEAGLDFEGWGTLGGLGVGWGG